MSSWSSRVGTFALWKLSLSCGSHLHVIKIHDLSSSHQSLESKTRRLASRTECWGGPSIVPVTTWSAISAIKMVSERERTNKYIKYKRERWSTASSAALSSRRRILPLIDLGIFSMNSRPPRSFLCGATYRHDSLNQRHNMVYNTRSTRACLVINPVDQLSS